MDLTALETENNDHVIKHTLFDHGRNISLTVKPVCL